MLQQYKTLCRLYIKPMNVKLEIKSIKIENKNFIVQVSNFMLLIFHLFAYRKHEIL